MAHGNEYDSEIHDTYIECPRCGEWNAPKESDEFEMNCHECGVELPVESSISVGEIVTVDVFDVHESGRGVGKLEDGLVVLVEGALPEARFKVQITRTMERYAEAEIVEKVRDEIPTETTSESEGEGEESTPSLGSREDFWGE